MALMARGLRAGGRCLVALAVLAATSASFAQETPALPDAPPGPFRPDASGEPSPAPPGDTDTWIFSGILQQSRETFSGTLVTSQTDMQFELKLADGATCDGSQLTSGLGLIKLSDVTCSDDRTLRALFVPQGGTVLKVFGHVGEERFATSAHLLGTEAMPEQQQTAEPKGPLGLPGPAEGRPPQP